MGFPFVEPERDVKEGGGGGGGGRLGCTCRWMEMWCITGCGSDGGDLLLLRGEAKLGFGGKGRWRRGIWFLVACADVR